MNARIVTIAALALLAAGPVCAKPKPPAYEAPAGCQWNETPMGSDKVLRSLICEQPDKMFQVWVTPEDFTTDVMAKARAGDPDALLALSGFYLNGPPGQIDLARSRALITQAAEAGSIKAMMALGSRLAVGRYGDRDGEGAALWWTKAADKGEAKAMTYLGILYRTGMGLDAKDPARALGWFRKGAAAGDLQATAMAGQMLVWGDGVPKDEAEGRRFLQTAADGGFAAAAQTLADLDKKPD